MPLSYPDDPRIIDLDTPAKQEDAGLVAFDVNGSPAKIYLDNLAVGGGDSNIIGEIRMYSGASSPDKWLFCDGSAVSRTTYADLFAVLGETFGVGDGSTTFNLPDFQGRSPVGVGEGSGLSVRALGDDGGEEAHQLIVSEMPSHDHDIDPMWDGGQLGAGTYSAFRPFGENTVTTTSTGGDVAHNTMHPFLCINFIIYAGVSA